MRVRLRLHAGDLSTMRPTTYSDVFQDHRAKEFNCAGFFSISAHCSNGTNCMGRGGKYLSPLLTAAGRGNQKAHEARSKSLLLQIVGFMPLVRLRWPSSCNRQNTVVLITIWYYSSPVDRHLRKRRYPATFVVVCDFLITNWSCVNDEIVDIVWTSSVN